MDTKTKLPKWMRKKLDESSLEEKFSHKLYADNSRVTVCFLLKDGEVIADGISLCSPKDNFSRLEGRERACTRALKSFLSGREFPIVVPTPKRWKHRSPHLAYLNEVNWSGGYYSKYFGNGCA